MYLYYRDRGKTTKSAPTPAILKAGAVFLKVETQPILRTAEMTSLKTTILHDINK